MTRLEIMKAQKELYAKLIGIIPTLEGIEKAVAQEITLEWIKGNNWLGGISDSKYNKASLRLENIGYTWEEIYKEFGRQMEVYG